MTEVLSPAGSFDKLKVAIAYGADAVYFSGHKFGLRSGGENFDDIRLADAVDYAHGKGRRAYVTLNAFHHEQDLEEMQGFIKHLTDIGVDAVIVSDPGAARMVLDSSPLRLHVSTQASVVNHRHAKIWKDMGASRIVLGREVTLEEATSIKEKSGIEVEMFGHGAMCMSYSGHCTISNFTAGRDSNRGGCIQSCRHRYRVELDGEIKEDTLLSSKDLMSVRLAKKFVEYGIDCLKIEGRMKSPLYAAASTRAYSTILSELVRGTEPDFDFWDEEIRRLSHRGITTGSLDGYADASSVYHQGKTADDYEQAGYILCMAEPDKALFMSTASVPDFASKLEFLSFGAGVLFPASEPCSDMAGESQIDLKPNRLYLIRGEGLAEGMVARSDRRPKHENQTSINAGWGNCMQAQMSSEAAEK